ncbi:hypothetical protein M569_03438 [Genlisea aurea]|uniref:Uncharacterized protein n=1 Tax=Genlisea aurea TaxID=192259 RepID=S8E694_9LAMI|nr:hypothetical protein M569_03438 [Genlisea aurea]
MPIFPSDGFSSDIFVCALHRSRFAVRPVVFSIKREILPRITIGDIALCPDLRLNVGNRCCVLNF